VVYILVLLLYVIRNN